MANQPALISSIDPQTDPVGYLGFIRHPDGSIIRQQVVEPTTSISSYENNPRLLVKDIPVNQSKGTFVRIFLPKQAIDQTSDHVGKKLPLIIFMHGGGYVIMNVNTPNFDEFYDTFTVGIPAVIVSMEYRRGPEHRLPAAYEDGIETLQWIKNYLPREEWFSKNADFGNAFLMGNSAGSNLAYFLSLRASSLASELHPLKIKGAILHQPFIGGTKRTESELRNLNDKILPPCVTDIMWELALPVGEDRDHEFCNPALSIKSGQFDRIKALGWKILVTGYENDVMHDRQVELVKMMEENGVNIVAKYEEGGYHGYEASDPARMKSLCEVVKEFVKIHSN
ncbi:OLC1v1031319C1 [Oldenlandia corymbosa var. corymbosa]|uniref:OLC1v1031319C1 n=1 Tax=Oldenlandia corymbosa var. corymbosa TaxID=529605 RepID=A0AAV1CIL8_OLDCO|nr:OLC1v1031319C1 [Oldenlandia corymbosa var. corymbosa]